MAQTYDYDDDRGGGSYPASSHRWREYDQNGGSSRRGFASMDPERRREISSMGGHASHGGYGGDHERGYDDRQSRSSNRYYENDHDKDGSSSRRGFASMDPERQREIASMGGRASHGGYGRGYDDDRSSSRYDSNDYGSSRGRSSSSSYRGREHDEDYGRSSNRGFAAMDPERRREIASMGGRASHGGYARSYDDDRSSSRYDSSDYGSSRSRSSSIYRGRDDERDYGRSSNRGFAAMDPARRREIASMGGRASHDGRGRDYDDHDRSSSSRRSRYEDDYSHSSGSGRSSFSR
jgi:general stress protein YciG